MRPLIIPPGSRIKPTVKAFRASPVIMNIGRRVNVENKVIIRITIRMTARENIGYLKVRISSTGSVSLI
ncbi:hypothetical protein D3C78_1937850 [compost metagenome]